jgi:hypothetical protein
VQTVVFRASYKLLFSRQFTAEWPDSASDHTAFWITRAASSALTAALGVAIERF